MMTFVKVFEFNKLKQWMSLSIENDLRESLAKLFSDTFKRRLTPGFGLIIKCLIELKVK
jgi:hypothetical protein